ncbi:MAG: lysophospholipid acyltransferase family protein [Planctomycetota bacterium]|nr:lysophospholipid acyltransferase family protein [Planctomycetota bacterium]
MAGQRKAKTEHGFKQEFLSRVAGFVNRVMTATCRTHLVHPTYHSRRLTGESVRCIYAGWHNNLWHGTIPLQGQGNWVLVSSHRDGEIIARMLGRRGFGLVRGSSTRGGLKALRDFARAAQGGQGDLIVTLDGPKGPARVAKSGALFTASLTGLPIVPVGMWVDRAWRLKSWDRLVIGKPFSRVTVFYGEELRIPRGVPREELETTYRKQLEEAMAEVEKAARDAAVG